MSIVNIGVTGWWKDIFRKPDGSILYQTGWKKNLIVENFAKVITGHWKQDGTFNLGSFQYAVGTGTVAAVKQNTQLGTEVFRKAVTSLEYLDSVLAVSATPTDHIQFTTQLTSSEANGNTLTEFGLFGGAASATVNSGFLMDRVVHAGIIKASPTVIDRLIRFEFTIP